MSTTKSVELKNKTELAKLSDEELDKYHIELQNHKDEVIQHLRNSVVPHRNERSASAGQAVIDGLSAEDRASLAQHIQTHGIQSLEGVNGQ